jgi:hypothetical protein
MVNWAEAFPPPRGNSELGCTILIAAVRMGRGKEKGMEKGKENWRPAIAKDS